MLEEMEQGVRQARAMVALQQGVEIVITTGTALAALAAGILLLRLARVLGNSAGGEAAHKRLCTAARVTGIAALCFGSLAVVQLLWYGFSALMLAISLSSM